MIKIKLENSTECTKLILQHIADYGSRLETQGDKFPNSRFVSTIDELKSFDIEIEDVMMPYYLYVKYKIVMLTIGK